MDATLHRNGNAPFLNQASRPKRDRVSRRNVESSETRSARDIKGVKGLSSEKMHVD